MKVINKRKQYLKNLSYSVEYTIEDNNETYYVSIINSDFGVFYNVTKESVIDFFMDSNPLEHSPKMEEQYTNFDGDNLSEAENSKFYSFFKEGTTTLNINI